MPGMEQPFTVALRYAAGLVPPSELPMAAAHLLAADRDSPALRDLAGRSCHEDSRDLHELFEQALGELGYALPGEDATDRYLMHHLAGRLTAGTMPPGEAAGLLWQRLPVARTAAEEEFLLALDDEYIVDLVAEHPEEYRAWRDGLRAAAAQLGRSTAAALADLERSHSAAGPGSGQSR
jgi:hypothetical protein